MTLRSALPVALQSGFLVCAGLVIAVIGPNPLWALSLVALAAGLLMLTVAAESQQTAAAALGILALALLAPRLRGGAAGGAPVRPEDLLIGATGLVLVLGRLRAEVRIPIVLSAMLAACVCFALIGSSITTDAATSWADLMFLVRLAKYLVVFCVISVLATRFDPRSARFAAAVLGLFGLAAAIGIAQYFNLFAINARLTPAYDDAALLESGVSWRRAFGTVGNSNYFGFLSAMGAAYALWAALTIRRGMTGISVVAGSLCLLGVLVSGSRGAFLALGAMVAVLLLTGVSGARQRRRLLIGGMAIAAAGPAILNFLGTMPFANRFFFVWGVQDSNSLVSIGLRRQLWEAELDRLEGHWLFGVGPQKQQLIQWVDNDFLRLTREFGLVTSVPYAVLLVIGALVLIRASLRDDAKSGNSRIALALVVGVAAMGLSSDVFYHEQSMAVVLVMLGLLLPRASA